MWGTRYLGLGRAERSTGPPQDHPEVRKRREPGPGGTKDGDGDSTSLLEVPPDGKGEGEEGGRRTSPLASFSFPRPSGAPSAPIGGSQL